MTVLEPCCWSVVAGALLTLSKSSPSDMYLQSTTEDEIKLVMLLKPYEILDEYNIYQFVYYPSDPYLEDSFGNKVIEPGFKKSNEF